MDWNIDLRVSRKIFVHGAENTGPELTVTNSMWRAAAVRGAETAWTALPECYNCTC